MSLLALPKFQRFLIENKTGQTLAANAVKIFAVRTKSASDGSLTYEASEATLLDNGTTIATATFFAGAAIDNSTDKYLAGDFIIEVTAPASSSGDVLLYRQLSTDGTRWPDTDAKSEHILTINFIAAGTKSRNFYL